MNPFLLLVDVMLSIMVNASTGKTGLICEAFCFNSALRAAVNLWSSSVAYEHSVNKHKTYLIQQSATFQLQYVANAGR